MTERTTMAQIAGLIIDADRKMTAAKARVEAQATTDEVGSGVDLVDSETGEVLDEDVPGLGQVTARPRLVLRRKGKATEATQAAEAAREELAEITASAPEEEAP